MDAAPDPRFARPRTLFFGVGAPKAATSWLDSYLRRHPEACLPVRKEQYYWTALRGINRDGRLAQASRRVAKIEARSVWQKLRRSSAKRRTDRAWRLTERMLAEPRADHSTYADVLFQDWKGQPLVGEVTPYRALLDAARIDAAPAKRRSRGMALSRYDMTIRNLESAVAEQIARALAALAPTYDFLRAKFGDAVPASWRRPGVA